MITWIALWFGLSIAVAILASNKGRSGFLWFLLAIVISPLLALIFCAVSKNLTQTVGRNAPTPFTHVKCPDCAELVLAEAKVCKHCGAKLIPISNLKELATADRKAVARKDLQNLAVGIGAILGIIALFNLVVGVVSRTS